MLGFIGTMLEISWRFLCYVFIFNVFIALIKSGKGTIRELRDTVVMAIKVGIQKLQGWLFTKYKEQGQSTEKEVKDERCPGTANGNS